MQKKISIILVAIIFGAILVFANSQGFLEGPKNAFGIVVSPVGSFFSSLGGNASALGGSLLNLGSLQKENANLSAENSRLKADLARLGEIEKENDSLRTEIDFVKRGKYDYETAEVVAYDPSTLRGMITVSKGEKDGLKAGMAVTSEGYLIGRVSEVTEHTSKIQLITDPTSAIPVSIQGTDVNGIAKGELGSGLTMEKIPQGEDVQNGQLIVTSGLGGEIPRGILIGEIEGVTALENSLFMSAKIRTTRNIESILRVVIIKST